MRKVLLLFAGIFAVALIVAALKFAAPSANVEAIRTPVVAAKVLPPSLNNPPIYPGAKQVETTSTSECQKRITFRSEDSNAQISAFYKEVLTKDGWEGPRGSIGSEYYQWSRPELFTGLPEYLSFSISAIGYTRKEIRLLVGCEQYAQSLNEGTPKPLPPAINVTQQQYEEALAKWSAAGIEEYEIAVDTLSLGGVPRTLRVTKDSNRIGGYRITEVFPSPTPSQETDLLSLEYVRLDTVEGMFEQVPDMLKAKAIMHEGPTGSYYMAYTVEFDPDLGYPVYLAGYPVTAPSVIVNDADWSKTVMEMKIIKKGATTP